MAGSGGRECVVSRPALENEAALDLLCRETLRSLPRADQRAKGTRYVHGLLRTPGRKSMRNIAAELGDRATEQNLHHFISDSTWSWGPVRQALTAHVLRHAHPCGWVLRPLTIPKSGSHSVGVGRQAEPEFGQILDGQRAAGVWAASAEVTAPVNWRLHLPQAWVEDRGRRVRAGIPDSTCVEPLSGCTISAFTAIAKRWRLPCLPVVFDARGSDVATAVRRLSATGNPFLARVSGTLPVVPAPAKTMRGSRKPVSAGEMLGASAHLRRAVDATGNGEALSVAKVRVRLASAGGRTGDLFLLGMAAPGAKSQLWLTDLAATPTAGIVGLSRLLDKVDRDVARIAVPAGIRDYVGRSFDGWHRHTTLVSIAHAARSLGASRTCPPVRASLPGRRQAT